MERVLTTDVCVVGAGPAGSILAHALGKAGKRVVLVEQGPAYGPETRASLVAKRQERVAKIFRAPTLERAGDVLVAMHSWQGGFLYVTFATMVLAVAAIVIGHLLDAAGFAGLPARQGKLAVAFWAVLIIVLLTVVFVVNPGAKSFIYAGF